MAEEWSPARLPAAQRLALAEVSGTGQRYCYGDQQGVTDDQAVAALHESTRDPVVLGYAMGAALATAELDSDERARGLALLYEMAGADADVAANVLAWHRDRLHNRGHR